MMTSRPSLPPQVEGLRPYEDPGSHLPRRASGFLILNTGSGLRDL